MGGEGGGDGKAGAASRYDGRDLNGEGTGRMGRETSGVVSGVGYAAGDAMYASPDDAPELDDEDDDAAATARAPCSARIRASNSRTSDPPTFRFHSR